MLYDLNSGLWKSIEELKQSPYELIICIMLISFFTFLSVEEFPPFFFRNKLYKGWLLYTLVSISYLLISAMPFYKDGYQAKYRVLLRLRLVGRMKSRKRNKNSQKRNQWRRVVDQLRETPFACFSAVIYFI